MIFIYLHLLPLPLPLIYYLHYLHKKNDFKNPTLFLFFFPLPCSFLRGDRCPPLLLGLYLCLDFTSEKNESLIKNAFFKPCFDTQPMAFPSEESYSPAGPHLPSPWPSTAQHLRIPRLRLLFHHNFPPTMQYNWLKSETQTVCFNAFCSELLKGPSLV